MTTLKELHSKTFIYQMFKYALMGGESKQRCEFGFDDNKFLDATFDGKPVGNKVLEIILETLQREGKKIDIRVIEKPRISDENVFVYGPNREVWLLDDYSGAKEFYCKGHMPGELKESLKSHHFNLDEEGRIINMHGSTCCAGCEYQLGG